MDKSPARPVNQVGWRGRLARGAKRLRAGASNKPDLGGVLQTNNIHIATCDSGQVTKKLTALKERPATAKAKAKFILATDGVDFEAEDLASGETVACAYKDFPDHFGFFLPLAGIPSVHFTAIGVHASSPIPRPGHCLPKTPMTMTWQAARSRFCVANPTIRLSRPIEMFSTKSG